MKKIIYLVLVIAFISISINTSFAASWSISSSYLIKDDVNIYKIYKETILSRHQISKDFSDWKKMNSKIEKYFISLYFTNDRKQRLIELEKKLGDILKKNEKRKLTVKEKKVMNVVKNLYLRTILELRKK